MPSVNNTLIGALRVEASLDSGKFVDGARKIQKESKQTEATVKQSFSGIGAAVKGGIAGFVGAFSVAAFTQLIDSGLRYASSLQTVSAQVGVTTRDLQGFRYAAGQLGVSQQEVDNGLLKLTETLGKVAAGAQAPTKALAAIGLTAKDVANLDTGAAFRKISDGLEKIPDRAQRAAVEVALFGESGAKLDTLLSGGSDRINELSAAAEQLGIVLSDEQIRKADETANKLDALKTVLQARVAGVVADNADSIYKLADAVANLVAQLPNAINQIKSFYANFLTFKANLTEGIDTAVEHPINRFNPLTMGIRGGQFHANRLATVQANRAEAAAITDGIKQQGVNAAWARIKAGANDVVPIRSTGSIKQFLAPPSRTPRPARARRAPAAPRDRSDDVTYQFAREQQQADMDILRAKQQLAGSSAERAALSLQLIQLEHDMQAAEIDDRERRAQRDFAEKKITKSALDQVTAQAAILRAKNNQKTQIELQTFAEEQATRKTQASFEADDQRYRFAIDALRAADQMATTQAEHRRIQLQILDAQIESRRLELEHNKQLAVRNGATAEEIANIQAQIDHLPAERAQGQAGVINSTKGPMEAYRDSLPHTADQINEAVEGIEVQGLQGLVSTLSQVGQGWNAMRDTAIQALQSIAQQLIQLGIQRMLSGLLGSALGGITGSGPGGAFMAPSVDSILAGGSIHLADGGFVSGRGTSTSDSIPAMLSDGEFVMRAEAVRRIGPRFLDAMNEGRVQHRKGGGLLGALSFLSPIAALATHTSIGKKLLPFLSPAAFLATHTKAGKALSLLSPAAMLATGGKGLTQMSSLGIGIGPGKDKKPATPAFVFNNYAKMTPAEARETGMQAAAGWTAEMARHRAKGLA